MCSIHARTKATHACIIAANRQRHPSCRDDPLAYVDEICHLDEAFALIENHDCPLSGAARRANPKIVGYRLNLCGIFSRISPVKDAIESDSPDLSWLFRRGYDGSEAPNPLKCVV